MSDQVCTCGSYGGEYPCAPGCPTHDILLDKGWYKGPNIYRVRGTNIWPPITREWAGTASIEAAIKNDPPVGG